jgi:hypothetical protein
MKDITVDADKFDALLRRMLTMKPTTAKELSAKLKKDKIKAKRVQKMEQTDPERLNANPYQLRHLVIGYTV